MTEVLNTIFGLHLGSTNSCVAFVDAHGKAVVIPNAEGERTTPSVVYFESDEQIVVGRHAKELCEIYPEKVAILFKRNIGDRSFVFEVDGREYLPEELSSLVIRKLVTDAEHYAGKTITDVVITCPAWFGDVERVATQRAAEIAGLNVRRIVNEPIAAVFSYGLQTASDETVLVYDLGGAMFDVSLVEIKQGVVRVISVDGDHRLGGRNWDEALVRYLLDQARAQFTSADEIDQDRELLQDLYLRAEHAKHTLSHRETTKIPVCHGGERVRLELTRDKFKEITSDLLESTINLTRQMLDDAKDRSKRSGDDPSRVTKILLTGGATRMPQVTERLTSEFCGQASDVEILLHDPEEALAKGAALYAAQLAIGNNIACRTVEQIDQKTDEVDAADLQPVEKSTSLALPSARLRTLNINPETREGIAGSAEACENTLARWKPLQRSIARGMDAQTNGACPHAYETYEWTVFAPPHADPGERFLVQTFVHPAEQVETVKRDALEFDDRSRRRGFRCLKQPDTESEITFHLKMPGLKVDNPKQSFVWHGRPEAVQFGVTVPQDYLYAAAIGTITANNGRAPLGRLKFKLSTKEPTIRMPESSLATAERRAASAAGDSVDCTVFAPASAKLGDALMIQVFVHQPEQHEEVASQASEFDGAARRRAFQSLLTRVLRGTELTFTLEIPGLNLDESCLSVVWNGDPQCVQFSASVPKGCQFKSIIGRVTVCQETIPIGHVKFKLAIDSSSPGSAETELLPVGSHVRHYNRAFVSYASEDRAKVIPRVQMLKLAGIDVFQDIVDLDPGARWERELYRQIDVCDVFFLFWSSAAKQSRWVRQELGRALSRQSLDEFAPPEILPVIIEGPPIEPPWNEISHLHFNDKLIYLSPA